MMEQPLVSIVVVSYNHSKYIRENLDSIKSQTYTNIELIVADDASQDNSVVVFEAWLKENNYPAKKNFHTTNTGLATTLNECTEIITGQYVKFIAADDYLHPESIAKCVEKLEELGEGYGMVFTDTYAIDDSSKIQNDIADYNAIGKKSPEEFKKALFQGNQIAALTVLMRTDVLRETGPYDGRFITEDYYRWLTIAQKYNIGYVPEKLAYYRMHDSNISKVKADRINEEVILYKFIFDDFGSNERIINSYFSEKYLQNEAISKDLTELYSKFPKKIKRLDFAIRHKIPVRIYELANKIV